MRIVLFLITIFCAITLNAQNYLISFTGTGASTTVNTVKVENLTAGTSLTLNGDDILRLTALTGVNSIENEQSSVLKIYPNPMTNYSTLEIYPPIAGDVIITVNEITGKQIFKDQSYLENGKQEFRISGLNSGLYLINIKGRTYQYSRKIFCSEKSNGTINIEKVSNNIQSIDRKKSEMDNIGNKGTIDMSYTTGDRLKFTGISGNYSSVNTDIPSQDKTITFNFFACADGDNNNYPVVAIGTQVWMAENLKTTKFIDGSAIPLVTNANYWGSLDSPGYCWYNNNAGFKSTYGALYNWYAVNDNLKICPAGWHVPDKDEWATLKNYLINNGYGYEGSGDDIGKSLAATSGWTPSGIPGSIGNDQLSNNSSGFSALPAGLSTGYFYDAESYANWWADKESGGSVYLFEIKYSGTGAVILTDYKVMGFSVRCLKD